MKNSLWSIGAGAVFSLAMSSVAVPGVAMAQVNLPSANCGVGSVDNNCLVFGDFSVYSLGLLKDQQTNFDLFSGYDFTYKPNEALVNIIDGAGTGTTLQGLNTSIDDPFRALTGTINSPPAAPVYVDNNLFLMSATSLSTGQNNIPSDPVGGPATDNTQTLPVNNTATYVGLYGDQITNAACLTDMAGCMRSWDASVSDVVDALNGDSLFFMFNFNETGDSGTLAGQDLLGWGRVTLYGANGSVTFDLSGANTILDAQRAAQTSATDDILTDADDLWAHVHSEICVNDTTGAVQLNACAQGLAGWHTVNQSLGVDQAGFALYSQLFNEALYSGLYTGMAVDIRLSHLNDGADNVWIMAGNIICEPGDPACTVPEPASIVLFGLALLSLAAVRRRDTRKN